MLPRMISHFLVGNQEKDIAYSPGKKKKGRQEEEGRERCGLVLTNDYLHLDILVLKFSLSIAVDKQHD